MAQLVKLEVTNGFVDENGGIWLAGMPLFTTPENADRLVSEGKCKRLESEPKPAPAPLKKEPDK